MYLKASYTVEGAGVIGISLIIIGMCILTAFSIYHESMDYMENTKVKEVDVPETFRQIRAGKLLITDIFN